MSTTDRPKVIDRFIGLRLHKREMEQEEKKIYPEVVEVLKKSSHFDGIQLITKERTTVKAEQAMQWAQEHLSEKDFESLFVKQFNPDAFLKLVTRLRRKYPEKMKRVFPDGIVTTSVSDEVRVTATVESLLEQDRRKADATLRAQDKGVSTRRRR